MNFLEAMEQLENGKKITRLCWKKRGIYLFKKGLYVYCYNPKMRKSKICEMHEALVWEDNYELFEDKKTLSDKAIKLYTTDKEVMGLFVDDVKEHLKELDKRFCMNKSFHQTLIDIFGEELIKWTQNQSQSKATENSG